MNEQDHLKNIVRRKGRRGGRGLGFWLKSSLMMT